MAFLKVNFLPPAMLTLVLASASCSSPQADAFSSCTVRISPPGNYAFSERTGKVVPADGGTDAGAETLQNCVDSFEG
ncbi:hypothetical protein [Algicella marina]|uniref:Uncharacterized protein n=1 Tax=Algicella marina TaxID=2683284 RepID=A0A6P1T2D0_9RHOB|nr:hypothetical protein [Algicella marina]QHQ35626.1 hypothetical protein GO499_10775 [Algicella marina]